MSDWPITEGMILRGAVALFACWADELDIHDQDPLENGRRWKADAEAVLRAALGDDDL